MKYSSRFEVMHQLQKFVGQDLRKLANEYHVTVFKEDDLAHRNKGWAGLTLEKIIGLANNSTQAADSQFWELKAVSVHQTNRGWRVKESMSIAQVKADDLMNQSFEQSHLAAKMKKLVIGTREYIDQQETSSRLLCVQSLDLSITVFWSQIQADYELIQNIAKTQGITEVTGHLGKLIQVRSKGRGHGSQTRAFYARPQFVEVLLGIHEAGILSCLTQTSLFD